jgi:hypothetical protein
MSSTPLRRLTQAMRSLDIIRQRVTEFQQGEMQIWLGWFHQKLPVGSLIVAMGDDVAMTA